MKLYHFCSDRHLDSILREGLTRGALIWLDGWTVKGRYGMQWLTSDPARENQTWCSEEGSTLDYDRCANRLTVSIPLDHTSKLLRFAFSRDTLDVPQHAFNLLTGGSKEILDWWIFDGEIPPEQIIKVERLGERESFIKRRSCMDEDAKP